MIRKSFKFRLYPNNKQKEFLAGRFGEARVVFNHCLSRNITDYKENGTYHNYNENCKEIIKLKNEDGYSWLNDGLSQSLQVSVKNLAIAYDRYFKKLYKYPKFKKRSDNQCIKIPQKFRIENNHLFIPKYKSGIKFVQDRPIEGRKICCFISKTKTDKYYVSIMCEIEEKPLPIIDKAIGIDLGLINTCITSDSQKVENPKFYRNAEKKIKYLQRQMSKKKKGSRNRKKARKKFALVHEKVKNKRLDFLHKLTSKYVNENQVIITENLKVSNMLKNHKLAKSISDVSWGELIRQLKYKSEWYGRTFHQIDTFYPSSKTCNKCQSKLDSLDLNVREWRCPNCNAQHDRDINAALNIRDQGLRDLSVNGRLADIKQKLGEALINVNDRSFIVIKSSQRTETSLFV